MEEWKQFTLYPPGCRNKFQPLQVLHTFLPAWLSDNNVAITQWHVLFEPSALIRFQSISPKGILISASEIALKCGLQIELGDSSSDLNPNLAYPGEDYHGEEEFYGKDLWKANCNFMRACGKLSLEIQRLPHERQVFMIRKFAHIYANVLGMNYLEEAAFAEHWKERALELYKTYGRS